MQALKNPTLTVQVLLEDFDHPGGSPKPSTLLFAPSSGNSTTAPSFYGRLDDSPDLFLITRQSYMALTSSVLTPVVGVP